MGHELQQKKNGGPITIEGKEMSKRNATKHGVFGKLLAKGECKAEWEEHRQGVFESLAPVNYLEEQLVEDIAKLLWRLRRVDAYEASTLRYQFECRQREANASRRAPSKKDLCHLSNLPDGKGLEKVLSMETHLRRQLDRAIERYTSVQRIGGQREGSVMGVVVIRNTQNCKTNPRRERLALSAPPPASS